MSQWAKWNAIIISFTYVKSRSVNGDGMVRYVIQTANTKMLMVVSFQIQCQHLVVKLSHVVNRLICVEDTYQEL